MLLLNGYDGSDAYSICFCVDIRRGKPISLRCMAPSTKNVIWMCNLLHAILDVNGIPDEHHDKFTQQARSLFLLRDMKTLLSPPPGEIYFVRAEQFDGVQVGPHCVTLKTNAIRILHMSESLFS